VNITKANYLIRSLIAYAGVGGIAALVEWSVFWICDSSLVMDMYLSTFLSWLCGTLTNWLIGRVTMFRKQAHKGDMLPIIIISAAGFGINVLLMWLFADLLTFPRLPAKIAATGVVFFYSFAARKIWVYGAVANEKTS
jgi:putative flippase GtrA